MIAQSADCVAVPLAENEMIDLRNGLALLLKKLDKKGDLPYWRFAEIHDLQERLDALIDGTRTP